MPEQHSEDPPGARREWWIAAALVSGVIVCRSAIFVFWERSHFDSDQAITGLMAKHLAEGRAFPVFWYGQSYMLAVESWLAVPLFVLFGASVTALKLPLLGINLAIELLLLRGFVRDLGLRPLTAVLPTLLLRPAGCRHVGAPARSQRRQRRAVSLRLAHLVTALARAAVRHRVWTRFSAPRVHALWPPRAPRD